MSSIEVGVNGVDVMSLSHSSLRSLLSSTIEARIVVLAREHSRLIDLHSKIFLLRARLKQAEQELLKVSTFVIYSTFCEYAQYQ